MESAEVDLRPAKRQRFFEPGPESSSESAEHRYTQTKAVYIAGPPVVRPRATGGGFSAEVSVVQGEERVGHNRTGEGANGERNATPADRELGGAAPSDGRARPSLDDREAQQRRADDFARSDLRGAQPESKARGEAARPGSGHSFQGLSFGTSRSSNGKAVQRAPEPSTRQDLHQKTLNVKSIQSGSEEDLRNATENGVKNPDQVATSTNAQQKAPSKPKQNALGQHGFQREQFQAPDFDEATILAVLGDIPRHTLDALREVSDGNAERAINMFLDGSWQAAQSQPEQAESSSMAARRNNAGTPIERSPRDSPKAEEKKAEDDAAMLKKMPQRRYVGAFGAEAWATSTGRGLLVHGQKLRIERTVQKHIKTGKFGKPIPLSRQKRNSIVRFSSTQGSEIGRLSENAASWVSSLMDQKVCHFEAVCVYAPETLKVSDTVLLQLRCYLLRDVFENGTFAKLSSDGNRKTGIFEEKETTQEQALRLRQVGLVKLFDEINLEPKSKNAMTQKHKRQGLLQAAEIAEQYELDESSGKKKSTGEDGSGTPSDEEEVEDGKELEQDQLDSLYKKAQSFDFDTPEYEPAESFVMDLRKYQKQALHWMINKERDEKIKGREMSMHPLWEEYEWPSKDVDDNELPPIEGQDKFYVNPYSGELSIKFPTQEQHCLGGILADEMGLGKTIEMLSLIHSNTPAMTEAGAKSNIASLQDLPRMSTKASIEPAPATTLVIAPMSLLAQWESEAIKASKPNSLKTLMYYGSEKSINLQGLCSLNPAVAPNVVITSYGVILSEYNKIARSGASRGSHGGLFSIDFHRIILDEAHYIKNRQSKTAKACYELSAKHRWVLTGTPIVNRLEDLFSLVRFLRVEPWSNFSFWKTFITVPFEEQEFIRALEVVSTVLEPLVMRRTKDMKTPTGEALVPLPPRTIDIEEIELSKAEQEVYDWIYTRAKRTFNASMEAGNILKSYTTIFAQLLRLRQSCCHPILTRSKANTADEEDAAAAEDEANGLADNMDLQVLIDQFNAAAEEQAAEQDSKQVAARYGAHVLKQIQDEVEQECPICAEEPMIEPAVTGCWHSACKKCLLDYIEHQRNRNPEELPRCFNCREPITERDVFEVIRHDDDANPFAAASANNPDPDSSQTRITLRRVTAEASSKIAALIKHLRAIRRAEPGTKTVVFSQFTSFLDLIGEALARENMRYLRFDGSMNQKQRSAVLAEFAVESAGADAPPDTKRRLKRGNLGLGGGANVLLLSLRAGGVGLNLTFARRVFMMDPWWSWAVEAQAVDRVHRMGQVAEVKVVRFVVQGSIEQRMLKVQERKKFIAGSLGMMSEEEKKLQRIEDIKELLS